MSGLQKVISILPDPAEAGALDLLVEAGPYGISCLWHKNKGKRIEGLLVHYGSGMSEGDSLAYDIRRIFESEPVLNEGSQSVRVYHNFPEGLIIPKSLFTAENAGSSMSLLFGPTGKTVQRHEEITGKDMVSCYRIPEPVDSFFNSYMFNYNPAHSFSCLLQNNNPAADSLKCTIYPGWFRLILTVNGRLQLAANYNYLTPEDISYTLLNACLQHGIKPADIPLYIDGMIERQSNLFAELLRFFNLAELPERHDELSMTKSISEYPAHFFNNLFELALCAS